MLRDLNDSLIFVKVVEQRSFTAAARALGVPKTTVSRKVRDLEDRLGASLLHRTTRRLALTEAGTVFFEHCQRIAQNLDEAEDAVHQLQGSPRGWLRFTAPYPLGVMALAPMMNEFRELYPDVRLDMVLTNDLLDIVGDEIDVALRFGDLPDSTFGARRLGVYDRHVYASLDYIARHGEPLEPEDLREHRALVMPLHRRGQAYCWLLSDGERSEEFPVQPVVISNDPFVLRPLLVGGQGVMLASDAVFQPQSVNGSIRRVLAGWKGSAIELNAVFPKGHVMSPKVRVFIDFLSERLCLGCSYEKWDKSADQDQEKRERTAA
ncbi:MAG: LysR substrate-binding domain-containing protein [Gammaproteobacteria bacterium]